MYSASSIQLSAILTVAQHLNFFQLNVSNGLGSVLSFAKSKIN